MIAISKCSQDIYRFFATGLFDSPFGGQQVGSITRSVSVPSALTATAMPKICFSSMDKVGPADDTKTCGAAEMMYGVTPF